MTTIAILLAALVHELRGAKLGPYNARQMVYERGRRVMEGQKFFRSIQELQNHLQTTFDQWWFVLFEDPDGKRRAIPIPELSLDTLAAINLTGTPVPIAYFGGRDEPEIDGVALEWLEGRHPALHPDDLHDMDDENELYATHLCLVTDDQAIHWLLGDILEREAPEVLSQLSLPYENENY